MPSVGSILNSLNVPTVILERTMGMPEGGPKAIPLSIDFSTVTTWILDAQNIQARGFIDMVQSIYIDNAAASSGQDLTIQIDASQQKILFPPKQQGYIPVIVPNPLRMSFSSASGLVIKVILLNFPIMPIIWTP